MDKLQALGVALATLLVSAAVLGSCEQKQNGCDKLDHHLVKHLPDELDAGKNYELASKINVLSFVKHKVAKEWKKIHAAMDSQSCSDDSIEAWLSFGKCLIESDQARLASILKPELAQYAQMCKQVIFTDYLPRQQVKLESELYSSVRKPLFSFLSDQFIADYRAANPDEPALHLGKSATGKDCCKPDKGALQVSFEALQRVVQKKDAVDPQALVLLREINKVNQLLDEYLFYPCETYQQMMYHHIYRDLIQSVRKFMPDSQLSELLAGANQPSSQFENFIFRYQFCYHLKNIDARKNFAHSLIDYIQKNKL